VTKYTYSQLEGLWINAGGSKKTAPIAAAIAEAESGGNSDATSSNPDGGENVGPWQLDTRGKGSGYSVAQLKDAATNAKVAVAGSRNGTDWSAWATYVSGAYKQFMSGKTTPDTNVPTPTTLTAAIDPYQADTCMVSFPGIEVPVLGNLGKFCLLSKSEARAWIGAGVLAGGVLLALPGLALVAAAAGMKALGAAGPVLSKTGAAIALVPGAEAAGVAVSAAGRAGTASAEQTRSRRQQAASARQSRQQAAGQSTAGQTTAPQQAGQTTARQTTARPQPARP